jgi:hypothetical protein
MNWFHAMLFVCTIGTYPSECTVETAVSVTQGPRVPNEVMCGKSGQAAMAANDFVAPRMGEEYLKISCLRDWSDI